MWRWYLCTILPCFFQLCEIVSKILKFVVFFYIFSFTFFILNFENCAIREFDQPNKFLYVHSGRRRLCAASCGKFNGTFQSDSSERQEDLPACSGYPAIYIAASSNIDSPRSRAASPELTSSAVAGRDPRKVSHSSCRRRRKDLPSGWRTSRSVSLLVCSALRREYTHTSTRCPSTYNLHKHVYASKRSREAALLATRRGDYFPDDLALSRNY